MSAKHIPTLDQSLEVESWQARRYILTRSKNVSQGAPPKSACIKATCAGTLHQIDLKGHPREAFPILRSQLDPGGKATHLLEARLVQITR